LSILVTGADGFIGKSLLAEMLLRGDIACGAVRFLGFSHSLSDKFHLTAVGDIGGDTDWTSALSGVECVIHCAARAYVMNEIESDGLAAYHSVNVVGTKRLAEQAAALDVRRLVYLSSVKVNGESTAFDEMYHNSDQPAPNDPYGLSKLEAEEVLLEVSAKTGLEIVIVRPPLVYGPGVKGNLFRLLKLVSLGIPLPLGAVDNRRSLIGLENLVDLLICCVDHPNAAGQILLVSDGEDLSTPDLIRGLAQAMDKSPKLLPVPVSWLYVLGKLTGKLSEVDRLLGSLRVDSAHTRELLDWTPPVSVEAGLQKTVDWFLAQ